MIGPLIGPRMATYVSRVLVVAHHSNSVFEWFAKPVEFENVAKRMVAMPFYCCYH